MATSPILFKYSKNETWNADLLKVSNTESIKCIVDLEVFIIELGSETSVLKQNFNVHCFFFKVNVTSNMTFFIQSEDWRFCEQ